MIVCHCLGKTERDVRRAVRRGAGNLAEVRRACGAGSGCGGCVGALLKILKSERAASSSAPTFEASLDLAPAS